ncbi:MAG: hypothetical protein E6686_10085 [Lachnospiraceae bacterium]|nr:hypothetical protein [Lachnospiraceae bacterium]
MKGKPITEWNCEAVKYMKGKEKAIEMFEKYLQCSYNMAEHILAVCEKRMKENNTPLYYEVERMLSK